VKIFNPKFEVMLASSNPVTAAWDAASAEERGRFYIERELQLHTTLHHHVVGPMDIRPDEDFEHTNAHKPTWQALRRATHADEEEFVRLFLAWAAEAGIEDFSLDKVRQMFSRALRQDRAALIVAGKPGHLQGFVLLGFSYVWFSIGAQMTSLCAFIDPKHRHSGAAEELLAFAHQPISHQEKAIELLA
jgi:hypothetical protein